MPVLRNWRKECGRLSTQHAAVALLAKVHAVLRGARADVHIAHPPNAGEHLLAHVYVHVRSCVCVCGRLSYGARANDNSVSEFKLQYLHIIIAVYGKRHTHSCTWLRAPRTNSGTTSTSTTTTPATQRHARRECVIRLQRRLRCRARESGQTSAFGNHGCICEIFRHNALMESMRACTPTLSLALASLSSASTSCAISVSRC